jgi:lysozyme
MMYPFNLTQVLLTGTLAALLGLTGCAPRADGSELAKADSLAAAATADSLARLAVADSIAKARKAQAELSPIGVAVTEAQGRIDWGIAKTEGFLAFAYMRATMGSGGADTYLGRNWMAAKREGLLHGAYHHYRVGDDVKTQLKNFTNHVKLETGDLRPAVQLDHTSIPDNVRLDKKGVVKAIQEFLADMDKAYGCKPLIFTTPDFAATYLDGTGFAAYPLWLNAPSIDPEPTLPATWATAGWTLWQFSESGSVPGIPENVARTRFHAPLPELDDELACAAP